jgi:hypothetical protein
MSKKQIDEYMLAIKELGGEYSKVRDLRERILHVAEELSDPLNIWVLSKGFPPRDFPDTGQIKETLKSLADAHKKAIEKFQSIDERDREGLPPLPKWAQ